MPEPESLSELIARLDKSRDAYEGDGNSHLVGPMGGYYNWTLDITKAYETHLRAAALRCAVLEEAVALYEKAARLDAAERIYWKHIATPAKEDA